MSNQFLLCMILFCLLQLFQAEVGLSESLPTLETQSLKIDHYEKCVEELSGPNWRRSVVEIEQRLKISEDILEKASISLGLGDYYSGLIDGPIGQVDLYKAFYYYVQASSQPIKHLERAQYMVGFLLSLHPEVAPEPYSKKFGESFWNITTNQPLSLLYYQFSALGGSQSAKLALAYRISRGASTPESCPSSFELYKSVAQKALANESWRPTIDLKSHYVDLSEEYESGKNTLENERDIIYLYSYSADNGNIESQVAMGTVYLEGYGGIPRDYDEAFKYYSIAAEDEDESLALLYLGYMHLHGYGTKADNQTAIKYFEEAVVREVPEASTQLGLMYLNGWSVKQDIVEAIKFFEIAAKRSEPWALLELGRLSFTGVGLTKNYQNAFKYFQKSSHSGNLPALYNLAILTFNGLGTMPSCTLAMQYLQKIIERTAHREANFNAYKKFIEGNYENALILYEMTADQGSILGQENAAWMYENSLGSSSVSQIKPTPYEVKNNNKKRLELVPIEELKSKQEKYINYSQTILNEKKALHLYQMAASQLSAKAYLRIGDYFYYGKAGLNIDYESAAAAYTTASNLKNAQAAFNLGIMHHLGIGLKKDLHLAKRNYDRAMEISPEAYVPSLLAVSLIQLDWAISQLSGGFLIMGMAWDTFLIGFLTTLLAIALGMRRFML